MDTKVACLLLIILGALTVQGAVSGNKRMNPLHARQYGEECKNDLEEFCVQQNRDCPPQYEPCDKYCEENYSCCCMSSGYGFLAGNYLFYLLTCQYFNPVFTSVVIACFLFFTITTLHRFCDKN
ncbi:small cysteine-rich protein 6-like [Orbicella faveolata]|uniref:small cysteine-rich protein 6-like n=1 Tax=Orbicella faveolata TaxID=48498 RepID=UPI0009E3EB55|nr:small cysteine-rich protein 6-like [Orbicella faveolata]